MSDPPAEITPGALRTMLVEGAPLAVLDVREDDERGYCTLPTPPRVPDLHIPLGSLPARLEEVRAATADGRSLVVYCHHGVRSAHAAAWLSGRGVGPCLNLEGGIDAWSAAVDPSVPRY